MEAIKPKTVEVMAVNSLAGFGITRVCLAIGVFDGVHLGHQLLLRRLLEMSRRLDAVPAALTFFPHPRQVLCPDQAPPLLLPPEQKARLLGEYGMQAVITLPFTRSFAALSPEQFIAGCVESPTVRTVGIAVGAQWRFGSGGSGNVQGLGEMAAARGWELEAVEELALDGQLVSSTAIRRAISGGLLDKAAALLGRPYALFGVVGHGYRVASQELSHPTANLEIKYGILPPDGVYAAAAVIDGVRRPAAVNIGICPTYNRAGAAVRVEVHVLDFDDNLYGREMELELIHYLREERTFSDSAALKIQIIEDVKRIRELIARGN